MCGNLERGSSYISFNNINFEEIMHVLLSIFKSSQRYDNRTIFFPSGNYDDCIIQLKTSGKNKIELIPTSKCDRETLQKIEEKIRTDIETYETKIGRDILFSSILLYGYFRYKDIFQIIPAPPQAPKPKYIFSGQHPILLEFKYKGSNNDWIDTYRRKKKSYEIALLLNLLLNANISNREYKVISQWVRCDGEPVSRLCTNEYVFENFEQVVDDFSDVSDLEEIKLIDPKEYYGHGQNVGEGLNGPTIINKLLDIVYSLDEEIYNQLITACKFLSLSNKLWFSSQSMAYIAAICAIESLTEKPKDSERCSVCQKHKNGPTKLFKDFLRNYGPQLPNKVIDELYNLRSNIAHRGFLFESDSEPWTFLNKPTQLEEEKKGIALRQIVQTAIIKWLIATFKNKDVFQL